MDSANITAHIHALTNDPASGLALTLLRDLPWETLLHNDNDPFRVYLTSRLLLQIMTIEPNETDENNNQEHLNNARHAWIGGLVQTIIPYQHSVYLEIFHAILKDLRKHPHENHVGFTLLSALIRDKNSPQWIQQSLSAKKGSDLVPLIMFLIDVVKTCKVLDDHQEFHQVSRDGWLWTSQYMRQICTFWLYPHIAVARRSLALAAMLLRYHKSVETIHIGLTSLVTYTTTLQQHLTREDLYSVFEPDRTEFFYSPINNTLTVDRECLKQATQIFLTALSALVGISDDEYSTIRLQELIHYGSLYCQKTEDILEIIFELHGNNDEDAVNFQLDILNLYEKLDLADETKGLDKVIMSILDTAGISPNRLFLFFCRRTGMDHSLLVDLLLSNETEFLLFFVKYLKYVERDPQAFVLALNDDDEDVLDMLRSLLAVLQAGGFPYNPTYLINRLMNVINLFE